MVIAAKKSKIKRFIYASSSSVYGVSKEKDVKEDHKLVPLTYIINLRDYVNLNYLNIQTIILLV